MQTTLAVLFALVISINTADAAQRPAATLRIVVHDTSGAVIPGALVQVRGTDDATRQRVRRDIPSNGQGVAVAIEKVN